MAFHHVPTFLRSALVRNPFCHGDIISAEDVLRLEAQYPNLFDKPHKLNVYGENTKDESKTSTKPQEQLENKHIVTKSRPFLKNQKEVKPIAFCTAKKKPSPSQYHRNCLSSVKGGGEEHVNIVPRKRINVPPKPLQALPAPNFASTRNRKLARPSQSFSLEDLRKTLREVMRDDVLYNTKTQNPSPYTEDLVKKFLGRKLQSVHSQKKNIASNSIKNEFKLMGFSGDDSDINGQGDLGVTNPFELRNTESNNYPESSSKEKVKRVRSAPGFIRSFRQPKTVYQRERGSFLQKGDEKKQVKWKDIRGSEEKGINTSSVRQDNIHESPEKLTQKSTSSTTDLHDNSLELKCTRGAQIHIRSLKLSQETEVQTESRKPTLPSSSFHHLLAARSVTSRYQMKGLLRRQNAEFCETNEKQRPTIPRSEHKCVSFEMRKASHASTTQALERIAKELVYTEILQQLHELKQKQTKVERTEKEKHDDTHSISFSSSPLAESKRSPLNFVPTSADERKSESLELLKSSESLVATLKTPELTPPSVPKLMLGGKGKKSSVSNISLHTPELSPSLRKIAATKKAQMSKQTSHPNLDTDCSEISDFIASEIAKDEKSGNPPESNKSGQESLKLVTPQLSRASVVNKNRPSKTFKSSHKPSKIEIPEFDASTLSGVSAFKGSNPSTPEKQLSLHEAVANIVSHKEEEQGPTVPHVKDMNGGSQKVETSGKEDEHENCKENSTHQSTYSADYLSESLPVQDEEPDMNVSGATVIDLLSEGEFIGTAYRSPGELSLRQTRHWRSSSRKVFENFSVSNSGLEDSKDDGESDLSFISSGLQILPGSEQQVNFSLGEYLQR